MRTFGFILLFANIAVLLSSSWLAVGIIGIIDFIWFAMAVKPAPVQNSVKDEGVISHSMDYINNPVYSDMPCNKFYYTNKK